MLIRTLLALLLIAVIVHESEPAPSPNKVDPFKPIYRILKEYRKIQKYKYKYGGRDNDESWESSEEQSFGFRPPSSGNKPNRPSIFPGSGNRPSLFPSGGNNGNRGGDSGGQAQPTNGGNVGGGGGGGDPFQQLNQGLSGLFQGLGSLTLGQLVGLPN